MRIGFMDIGLLRISAIAALMAISAGAAADPLPRASRAVTGAQTSVPYGWVDFCQRYAGECDGPATAPRDLHLSARALRDLSRVNAEVNARIEAVSDKDHWGAIDRWDYPDDGKGDCEDVALLKRRTLIGLGYPAQALLMTVVKDKNGDGHAVLTARTDRGDFVLDNLDDQVKDWRATDYRFVKRQSQADVNAWVAIGPPTDAPAYVSR